MNIYINKIKWVVGSDKLPVGRKEVIKRKVKKILTKKAKEEFSERVILARKRYSTSFKSKYHLTS